MASLQLFTGSGRSLALALPAARRDADAVRFTLATLAYFADSPHADSRNILCRPGVGTATGRVRGAASPLQGLGEGVGPGWEALIRAVRESLRRAGVRAQAHARSDDVGRAA